MKFLKNPELVEAVQWNGENLQEVRELLGVDLIYTVPGRNVIPLLSNVGKTHADIGDWMVKGEGGAVVVVEPANMLKLFRAFDFIDMEGVCGCCGFKGVPVIKMPKEKAYICNVCLVEKTPQRRAPEYIKQMEDGEEA